MDPQIPAMRQGLAPMPLMAMILGLIGGLGTLYQAGQVVFGDGIAVAPAVAGTGIFWHVGIGLVPLLALGGAGLASMRPIAGGFMLLGAAGLTPAALGFAPVAGWSAALLAVAGGISLFADGVAAPDGTVKVGAFWVFALLVGAVFLVATRAFIANEYFFFAGYVVLQYIVLSTAWNILGGYTGYTNFGTAAFFALGAYASVVLHKTTAAPLPVMIIVGGVVSGIIGFGMGYLTLRLRGVFFAIATLAMAIVVQTLIVNWDYVGGSRGIYIIRPQQSPIYGSYIQYLYSLMLILVVLALGIARTIERSRLGLGFAAIRDDEQAAEAGGVPTLRLKLIATTLSGAMMGMAGAPLPYYVTYLDPTSSFNLAYAVNSVAMPVIGGMTSWIGPLVGAVLLGTIQQLATVTISSAANLLIVGLLLIAFVIIAPNGLVGVVRDLWRRGADSMRTPS
jgi:branched-chain amino acid transport system permease protein